MRMADPLRSTKSRLSRGDTRYSVFISLALHRYAIKRETVLRVPDDPKLLLSLFFGLD